MRLEVMCVYRILNSEIYLVVWIGFFFKRILEMELVGYGM